MVSSEEFFSRRPVGIDSEAVSVEAALRVLVNRFPSIGSFPQLKKLCKEQTGDTKVTLSWFYEEYPSFPVRVIYKNIPWIRDMWAGLHNGFKKTELYSAWKSNEETFKLNGTDDFLSKPTAIVFNWPSWKTCCIHNLESKQFGGSWYSVAAAKDDDCLKIYKSLKNGESFVIEPFEQLLDSITWSN
jgi:hypothetical protein